jgi:pyruvate/2-oxoglutarate/acetoin dehydrogenase E1 component
VAARAVERIDGLRVRRVAALDLPIANAKSLEDAILPSVQDIISAVLDLLGKV